MVKKRGIKVNDNIIGIVGHNNDDYISLTDMARNLPNSHLVIGNWIRKKDTIEYLGLWEHLYNPDFKLFEFEEFKNESGTNRPLSNGLKKRVLSGSCLNLADMVERMHIKTLHLSSHRG